MRAPTKQKEWQGSRSWLFGQGGGRFLFLRFVFSRLSSSVLKAGESSGEKFNLLLLGNTADMKIKEDEEFSQVRHLYVLQDKSRTIPHKPFNHKANKLTQE